MTGNISTELTVSTKKEQRSKKERNCGYEPFLLLLLLLKTKAL